MGRKSFRSEWRDKLACEGLSFNEVRYRDKKNTTLSIAVIRIYMVYQPGDQHLSALICSRPPPPKKRIIICIYN